MKNCICFLFVLFFSFATSVEVNSIKPELNKKKEKVMNIKKQKNIFCQSCAMPMKKVEDFGTNKDGTKNQEYCSYCFNNGEFIDKVITMDQMIKKCVGIMRQMNMSEVQIEQTKKFIPTLKRWQR